MSIRERGNRYTFDFPRDEHGHGDLGAAFVQGLPWARGTRADFLGELPPQPAQEEDMQEAMSMLH